MKASSRLNVVLSWMADRFVIGTIVAALSCFVVSAPAAFAAGIGAGRETSLRAAVPQLFRAFLQHMSSGWKLGVVLLVLLTSSLVNVLWLMAPSEGLERVAAFGSGVLAFLASVATLAFGASLLDTGVRATAKNVLVLVSACPGAFALVLSLIIVGIPLCGVAPILVLPMVGTIVQVLAGVRVRYERRVLPRTVAAQ